MIKLLQSKPFTHLFFDFECIVRYQIFRHQIMDIFKSPWNKQDRCNNFPDINKATFNYSEKALELLQ